MQGNRIREFRTEKGMTLSHFSELTGVSIGYICHLEKGTRNNPSMQIMEKISKCLNKSVSEIFFNNEKWILLRIMNKYYYTKIK